jgi:hypothetical protein
MHFPRMFSAKDGARGAGSPQPRALKLCASAYLLACLLSSPAAAYTLVMRGGQRVEIPDKFLLDGRTLTYEVAPGLSVTLQIAHIDVDATERANRETPGGFLRHATANEVAPTATLKKPTLAPRADIPTVTNRELEPARQARLRGERDYERRRRELGLPTLEESRRRAEEDGHELRERARRGAEREAEAEEYWRGRALSLREESRALDAEINYLRSILPPSPDGFAPPISAGTIAFGAFSVGGGGFGVGGGFFHGSRTPQPLARTPAAGLQGANFGALQTNGVGTLATAQLGGDLSFGSAARNGSGFTRRGAGGFFARRGFQRGVVFTAGTFSVVAPFDYASADAAALVTRLRLLEAAREGLDARWRELEDEARRAGALPGWLRP